MFVIDTSVTMAWCFEDEATPATDAVLHRLRDERAAAPEVWRLEVANVLAVAQRKGRVTEAQSARFLTLLARLPLDVGETAFPPPDLLATARAHRLSAYAASYLLLAERLGAPVATLDASLSAACRTAGVDLLL